MIGTAMFIMKVRLRLTHWDLTLVNSEYYGAALGVAAVQRFVLLIAIGAIRRFHSSTLVFVVPFQDRKFLFAN